MENKYRSTFMCQNFGKEKKTLYIDNQKGLVTDEIKRKYLV